MPKKRYLMPEEIEKMFKLLDTGKYTKGNIAKRFNISNVAYYEKMRQELESAT